MQGRRVYPDETGQLSFAPGDYGFDPKSGHWMAKCPGVNCHLGDLSAHSIVEHEDGTITVSPSILQNGPGPYHVPSFGTWHGYLERGVWREC